MAVRPAPPLAEKTATVPVGVDAPESRSASGMSTTGARSGYTFVGMAVMGVLLVLHW